MWKCCDNFWNTGNSGKIGPKLFLYQLYHWNQCSQTLEILCQLSWPQELPLVQISLFYHSWVNSYRGESLSLYKLLLNLTNIDGIKFSRQESCCIQSKRKYSSDETTHSKRATTSTMRQLSLLLLLSVAMLCSASTLRVKRDGRCQIIIIQKKINHQQSCAD